MTDPLRPRDREGPARAAPLQPDKPGSGQRRERPGEQPAASVGEERPEDPAQRAREQEDTARDNVRQGYD